jgi:hypothetical protein
MLQDPDKFFLSRAASAGETSGTRITRNFSAEKQDFPAVKSLQQGRFYIHFIKAGSLYLLFRKG